MQNIVNYLSPFFGTDGKPVANGRVHFCRMSTSAVKWDDIGDPDYIVIKDRDGVQLPNPLPLNDMGVFEHQPFVEEQQDFKMYVDSPTGISSTVVDAEISDIEKWRTVLVMASRSQKVSVELSGISYMNSVAELREADTSAGCAVVLGYDEAGDFCPARVFFWSKTPYSENYGTHIKSLVDNAGTWVCEPSDMLDLRWFGVDADSGSTVDYTDIISSAANNYPNKPVYFSKGNYYISHNVSMASAVMDPGCFIRPYGSAIVQMAIEHLEDRGAKFISDGSDLDSAKVIPVIGGVFRSSIVAGNLCTFVFDANFELTRFFRGCDVIILDSFSDDDSVLSYEAIYRKGQKLEGKVFLVDGGNIPRWLTAVSGSCVVCDLKTGNIKASRIVTDELVTTEKATVGDMTVSTIENGVISVKQNDVEIIRISEGDIEFYAEGTSVFKGNVVVEKGILVKSGSVNAINILTKRLSVDGVLNAESANIPLVQCNNFNSDYSFSKNIVSEVTDFSGETIPFKIKSSSIDSSGNDYVSIPSMFPYAKVGDIVRVVHNPFAESGNRPRGNIDVTVILDGTSNPATTVVKGRNVHLYYCWKVLDDGTPFFMPVGSNVDVDVPWPYNQYWN